MGTFASDSLLESDRESGAPASLDAPPDDYRGLWAMYADSLRGPRRELVRAALMKGVLFYLFGVYCAVQAILSADIRSVVLWSLGCLWSIAVVCMVKLWWWMEMNRKSILRCTGRDKALTEGGGA